MMMISRVSARNGGSSSRRASFLLLSNNRQLMTESPAITHHYLRPSAGVLCLDVQQNIVFSSEKKMQHQLRYINTKTTSATTATTANDKTTNNISSNINSASASAADDHSNQQNMALPAHEFAQGCSFLHQVALGVSIESLTKTLDQNPSLVNFRDYDRRSPLHVAASEGHLEHCQFLVDNGAKLNRSDRWGGAPLDDAHRHKHAAVFTYLRQQGAVFGSPSQANNFIAAASEGDMDEVRTLLEYAGGDEESIINKGDYDKRTALHLAAGEGHPEIVRLLCEAGANVNVRDRWGNRPLDDAKSHGATTSSEKQAECIRILEEYGAKHGAAGAASSAHEAPLLDLIHQYGKIRNGALSMDWHDVKNLLQGIGHHEGGEVTDEVVQKLFEVADVDRDGIIYTQEFIDNSETFLGGRPARIILIVGGPGSGKGVLSERLVKECGVVHLSSGELLRSEVEQGTTLGKQVQDIMSSGGLVSSAIMVTLMQKRMNDHPGKRILLDGFPRSRENAEDLVMLCGKPELALHVTCDDTVLLERILKRGESGARADDNVQTALERIRTYHKYHKTTVDFLREQHVPVVYLDGSSTADGVWEQLRAIGRLMRQSVRLPGDSISSSNGNNKKTSSDFEIP